MAARVFAGTSTAGGRGVAVVLVNGGQAARRRADAGEVPAQGHERGQGDLLVSRLHERGQREQQLGVAGQARRLGRVRRQRVAVVGQDVEQLLPGGRVADGRQPGQRRGMPAAVRPSGNDRGQILRRARVVERRQNQRRLGRVRDVGQVLGGQRIAVGQFVPREQAGDAQLVRQVRLRLEQRPHLAGRHLRIEVFQRRQRDLLELVVVPPQPARQHGHGPIVAQAAQRPGDVMAVRGRQGGLAGGGQQERQARLAPDPAQGLDLGFERLPRPDRPLQAGQQDSFGPGGVEPERRAGVSRFARRRLRRAAAWPSASRTAATDCGCAIRDRAVAAAARSAWVFAAGQLRDQQLPRPRDVGLQREQMAQGLQRGQPHARDGFVRFEHLAERVGHAVELPRIVGHDPARQHVAEHLERRRRGRPLTGRGPAEPATAARGRRPPPSRPATGDWRAAARRRGRRRPPAA